MAIWNASLRLPALDPYTEEDFLFEWGDYLNGSNIAAMEVSAVNATVDTSAIVNAAQDVTCRISQAILDSDVVLSCKITTNDSPPRKDKKSVTIAAQSL